VRARAVGVAALVLAGAVGAGVWLDRPQTGSTDGPLVIAPPTGDSMDALSTGPVELDRGCLRLGDAVAVWPAGSSWDAEAQTVTAAGTAYPLGQPVELGGGQVPVASTDLGGAAQQRLEECAEALGVTEAWFVAS
jgi:hypothetical protein